MKALMKSTVVEEAMHKIEAVIHPFLLVSSPTLCDIAEVFEALHVPFDTAAAEQAGYHDCLCVWEGAGFHFCTEQATLVWDTENRLYASVHLLLVSDSLLCYIVLLCGASSYLVMAAQFVALCR